MRRFLLPLICVMLGVLPAHAYDYPFKDPYAATVMGTLPEDELPLSSVRPPGFRDLNPLRDLGAVRVREILMHDRPVPELLWYDDALQYSTALQRRRAPLLFVIAGTGSSYDSANCRYLQQVFHRAGFHVVTLSSPTYPNFVVSASSTQVPGFIPQDVADLYRCMNAIADEIGREQISSVNLTGYSLGGTQAAFLAELDSREKRLGFRKILMINPAVNLMTSAMRLDRLLADNVRDRADAAHKVAHLVEELSAAYKSSSEVNFGDDFLYSLGGRTFTETELKILIGVAFRVSLANMVFTSDVCTGAGYIAPRGRAVTREEPLSPYMDAAVGVTFEDYVEEYLLPFLVFKDPSMTRERAIAACSLESIAAYLRKSSHIKVMTNRDDLILTREDLSFLGATFGPRLKVYPVGGHCGNLRYRDNVAVMLDFFQK